MAAISFPDGRPATPRGCRDLPYVQKLEARIAALQAERDELQAKNESLLEECESLQAKTESSDVKRIQMAYAHLERRFRDLQASAAPCASTESLKQANIYLARRVNRQLLSMSAYRSFIVGKKLYDSQLTPEEVRIRDESLAQAVADLRDNPELSQALLAGRLKQRG